MSRGKLLHLCLWLGFLIAATVLPLVKAECETPDWWGPTYEYKTTVKNPGWIYIWDGEKWVWNTPIVEIVGNRILVTYPKLL